VQRFMCEVAPNQNMTWPQRGHCQWGCLTVTIPALSGHPSQSDIQKLWRLHGAPTHALIVNAQLVASHGKFGR
jgi:hypothetical protein